MYVKSLNGLSLGNTWLLQLGLYLGWITLAALAFLLSGNISTLSTGIYLPGILGVILYVLIVRKKNFSFVPRIRISPETLLLAFFMGLSMIILKDAVSHWFPLMQWKWGSLTAIDISTPFSILGSVVLAAFMEEILFRGIMMEALLKRYSGNVALLQSSLLFMLAHPDPSQMPGAFLLGMLTGYFYLRQRDLCMCFFIHLTNNVAAAVLMMNSSLFLTTMEPQYYYGIVASGVTILFAGYFLLKRFTITSRTTASPV